ncbi:MAG: chromophore lyase CpcT/CpeT, partial [Vulcanococcus sp.]
HDDQRFWGAVDHAEKRAAIRSEDLRPLDGCAYVVRESAAGFSGEVEPGCRCLVERKGAMSYLVSSFELSASGMRTIDRGHDPATHEQLWGSLAGPFEFVRTDDYSHELPEHWLSL